MNISGIYAQELGYVRWCLRELGARPPEVDDMAQEVFARLAARSGAYDESRPIRPFLTGLANRVVSEFRRRERRQKLEQPPWAPSASRPDDDLEQNEIAFAFAEALKKIPASRREIFQLHEIEGIPIPEVAARAHLPLNTAYSRLRLGKNDFRSAILMSEVFEPQARSARKR